MWSRRLDERRSRVCLSVYSSQVRVVLVIVGHCLRVCLDIWGHEHQVSVLKWSSDARVALPHARGSGRVTLRSSGHYTCAQLVLSYLRRWDRPSRCLRGLTAWSLVSALEEGDVAIPPLEGCGCAMSWPVCAATCPGLWGPRQCVLVCLGGYDSSIGWVTYRQHTFTSHSSRRRQVQCWVKSPTSWVVDTLLARSSRGRRGRKPSEVLYKDTDLIGGLSTLVT